MHVGTNNVEYTPEQVCEGILEIIRTIREKHPSAYIVLPVSMNIMLFNHNIVRYLKGIVKPCIYFTESTSSWSISKHIEGKEFEDQSTVT